MDHRHWTVVNIGKVNIDGPQKLINIDKVYVHGWTTETVNITKVYMDGPQTLNSLNLDKVYMDGPRTLNSF